MVKIVSRGSPLALRQANLVQQQLAAIYPEREIEIQTVKTQGDKLLTVSLAKVGGKGLFVKELELCLLKEQADIAVHSLKDMPAQLPAGLELAVVLPRADPRDVLVSYNNQQFCDLPEQAIIGTSSLRRQCQLCNLRPDIVCKPVRGNIATRIQHVKTGRCHGVILAAAGLLRLGSEDLIAEFFTTSTMLPAIGQGAIVIESRAGDNAIKDLLAPLHDKNTASCVTAERAINEVLLGSCQSPIAGFAEIIDNELQVKGLVAMPDGSKMCAASAQGAIAEATTLGHQVAEQLLAQGADKIIAELSHGN